MQKKKDKLTIHEVAKLNGISTDSLRYYEKIGLLTPSRGDNKYRYYTLDDLMILNLIREFRTLNFSFPQIKEMLKDQTLASTSNLLQHELTLIDNQIAHLKQTRKTLLQRLNTMNSFFCQAKPHTVGILELPEMKCLHIVDGPVKVEEIDYYLSDYARRKKLDMVNIIGRYDLYRLDTAHRIDEKRYDVKEILVTNNAMQIKPDFILPSGPYLGATYHGTEFLSGVWVDKIKKYATLHHVTLEGDFFEFRIFDLYDTNLPDEYLSAVCGLKYPTPRYRLLFHKLLNRFLLVLMTFIFPPCFHFF